MTEQQGSLEIALAVGILVLLFADVRPDLLEFESDRGHRVPPSPEMFAGEVALLAATLPGDGNRTLAFQKPDPLRHRHLGGNSDTHRDMIRQDMALDNLPLFLARQRVQEGTQVPPNLALQLPPPSFGNKHMRLALPAGMRPALRIVFPDVL